MKHVLPAIIRPAHTLWNEIIGFLFLSLAVIFGFNLARYYLAGDTGRAVIASLPTFLMAWFGISSFRRARKISRS